MPNPGVAPVNTATTVGQLRALLRDTDYIALVPPVSGQGDYAVFSDAMLESALIVADNVLLRAAAAAVQGLALEYSMRGRSIKTDDLAIDHRDRGKNLLEVAKAFTADADAADAAGALDFFELAPTGGTFTSVEPELDLRSNPWASSDPDDFIPSSIPGYWTTP